MHTCTYTHIHSCSIFLCIFFPCSHSILVGWQRSSSKGYQTRFSYWWRWSGMQTWEGTWLHYWWECWRVLSTQMFTQNAWAMVEDVYKQKVKKMNWICSVCYHHLNDAQSIACDSCLLWYHFKCCGVTKQPKTTTWFCRKCFADTKRKCTDE